MGVSSSPGQVSVLHTCGFRPSLVAKMVPTGEETILVPRPPVRLTRKCQGVFGRGSARWSAEESGFHLVKLLTRQQAFF